MEARPSWSIAAIPVMNEPLFLYFHDHLEATFVVASVASGPRFILP